MKRKHRHGSVEEHPKGSGRWRVRARIGGRLRVVVSDLASRAAAEEHADAYARERAAVELREGITLAQFGQGFLDRRETIQKARSIDEDRNRWKSYVESDPIGRLPVSALRRSDVVEWRDRLLTKKTRRGRHGLGAQTVKNALSLLRTALNEAADRDLLESNPAKDVKLPRGLTATHKVDLEGILLPGEQNALMAAVPAHQRPAVLFALAMGVRWSELSWLRWEDLQSDAVVIRRSKGGKPTKSGKPRRLPLSPPAKLALEEARALRKAGCPWVFPGPRKGGPRKQAPSQWDAWLSAAGITKHVSFHDVRHTTATALLAGWWGRNQGDQAAFVNRRSRVQVSKLAPQKNQAFALGPATAGEQTWNLPRRLAAALTAGPAPHVVALAEAYQAAMRKDATGARDALAKCAAELLEGRRAG